MTGQSNTETLLSLSGELGNLANRIDILTRRILHRDEIMGKLLRSEITTRRALEMMQEADR